MLPNYTPWRESWSPKSTAIISFALELAGEWPLQPCSIRSPIGRFSTKSQSNIRQKCFFVRGEGCRSRQSSWSHHRVVHDGPPRYSLLVPAGSLPKLELDNEGILTATRKYVYFGFVRSNCLEKLIKEQFYPNSNLLIFFYTFFDLT